MVDVQFNARERILSEAGRLFYSLGIHSVGIDRIVAEAGVAKATLYAHFSGKDKLVAAYLSMKSKKWTEEVRRRAAGIANRVDRTLVIFDLLEERVRGPEYRGCPFINAAAEFPGPGVVADEIVSHRRIVRGLLRELMSGVPDNDSRSESLLDELTILYDGAMTAAYLEAKPEVVSLARNLAESLLVSGDPRFAPNDRAIPS